MTRTEIKILLLEKGMNQTILAEKLGQSPQVICDILAHRRKAYNLRPKIKKILGVDIFGDDGNQN
jgi:ribosome-binding protein aMBF1 (putative translation factor)